MEPAGPTTSSHPLVAVLGRLDQALDDAAQVPVFTLDPDTTATTLRQLVGLQSRLAVVTLSVLAHGEVVDVAATSGASSTSTWLAAAVNASRPDAHRQARLARSLTDPKHGCVP